MEIKITICKHLFQGTHRLEMVIKHSTFLYPRYPICIYVCQIKIYGSRSRNSSRGWQLNGYSCARKKKLYCITKALISRWKTLHSINTHCVLPSRLKTGYTSSLSHQTFSRLLSIVKIFLAWKFFSSFFFLLLFLIYRPLFYAQPVAIFLHRKLCTTIFLAL